jgi:hypothetical protein
MLRLCPRGQGNNDLFNYLYLNKLPRELQVLLSEVSMEDKQSRVGSGLCKKHLIYEPNAIDCVAPCSWTGN